MTLGLLTACAAPQTQAPKDDSLPEIFQKQNQCFVEAGKTPIKGLDGGHELTAEEYAVFQDCMNRP